MSLTFIRHCFRFIYIYKAFDSVPHHRLLVKLKNFGIPDDILGIVETFLAGRSMRVKVGDEYSEIDEVGLMTYRERLDKLKLTTLLERRVH